MTKRTPYSVLCGLETLFADPANHSQGSYARRADGTPCDAFSDGASCWCLLGGVERMVGPFNIEDQARMRLDRDVTEYLTQAGLELFGTIQIAADVNDVRGHAAVMQLIARAKDLARTDNGRIALAA
ncbi:hypothetical protein [Methylobacterium ajmalii]|uniref:DUF6197 family protein n=1 Tax=Methylobacterium ajmalii TaxID=2738439 RepID=UPI002F360CCA